MSEQPGGKLKWVDLFACMPDFTGDQTTEGFLAETRGEPLDTDSLKTPKGGDSQ